jgi:hypothetical protein
MWLLRRIVGSYLGMRLQFHKFTGTGAFGPHSAIYLDSTRPVNGHALKRALSQHYVKQFHESSCSVASVVTVINALGSLQQRNFSPVTQMDILEKVRTGHWKERMEPGGHNGRRGLPLQLLKEVTQASLEAYRIDYEEIAAIQAEKKASQAAGIKTTLRHRLKAFEKYGRSVIIAHFDQGIYVRSENIPHISPVGGFDLKNGRVTILDVDRYQEHPYRIDFDTFYKGMASDYHHLFRPFGYGSGGYIWIKLNSF